MQINKILIIVALVLAVLSVLSYRQSVTRAERFERGQKFLPQLNPDEIDRIEITKGEEQTTLQRGDDAFSVVTSNNYPAKNETVNRFINDLLGISLEKAVGSGESIEKELELTGGENSSQYVLKNNNGRTLVQFAVGKATDDGRGNFIKRVDGDDQKVYLTSKGVFLTTAADSFLKKEILNVEAAKVKRIVGKDYELEEKDGKLALKGLPTGKVESSNVSQAKSMLSYLRFDKVFVADDPEVRDLNFDTRVEIELGDESGFRAQVAVKDDKKYLKVQGFFNVEGVSIAEDESEEELEKKSKILERGNEINDFNNFHGSWVYQLPDTTAEKFQRAKADFFEDEKKDDETEGE